MIKLVINALFHLCLPEGRPEVSQTTTNNTSYEAEVKNQDMLSWKIIDKANDNYKE